MKHDYCKVFDEHFDIQRNVFDESLNGDNNDTTSGSTNDANHIDWTTVGNDTIDDADDFVSKILDSNSINVDDINSCIQPWI